MSGALPRPESGLVPAGLDPLPVWPLLVWRTGPLAATRPLARTGRVAATVFSRLPPWPAQPTWA
jgi:hypothetical protein